MNCIRSTTDINYIWTSRGRLALFMEVGRNNPQDIPFEGMEEALSYDASLRAWVADLATMHAALIQNLKKEMSDAKDQACDTEGIEQKLAEFDVTNICDKGNWANGVALTPFPKSFLASKWAKVYFPVMYENSNKMFFHKAPATRAPPFIQVKKHRVVMGLIPNWSIQNLPSLVRMSCVTTCQMRSTTLCSSLLRLLVERRWTFQTV